MKEQRRWKVGERLTLHGYLPVQFYGYADDDPTGAYVYKLRGGGVWYVGTEQLSKTRKA
jgi:hypothetical protein